MNRDSEEQLAGGLFTPVARVGAYVHRETGPWTPVVHALLDHLEDAGFEGAPRVRGFDEDGREVLTFMEGEPGSLRFPPALFHLDGVATFGRFVREFHDAAASFVPGDDAVYRVGRRPLRPGEIVRHGDLGHWNTIWLGEELVGLIDWDFAEPGPPLHDLAGAAMPLVPFRDDEWAQRMIGFDPAPRRHERLATLCAAYGEVTPSDVLDAAVDLLALELDRLRTLGADGVEPWASNLSRGQDRLFEAVDAWIAANRVSLL